MSRKFGQGKVQSKMTAVQDTSSCGYRCSTLGIGRACWQPCSASARAAPASSCQKKNTGPTSSGCGKSCDPLPFLVRCHKVCFFASKQHFTRLQPMVIAAKQICLCRLAQRLPCLRILFYEETFYEGKPPRISAANCQAQGRSGDAPEQHN